MNRFVYGVALAAVFGLMAGPLPADKVYDPGTPIGGMLMHRHLDIPISLPDTGDFTDEEWVYAMDQDHYILRNEQGMQIGEGLDPDMITNYNWTCSGGSVTQGSATTTWTSPGVTMNRTPLASDSSAFAV